MIFPVRKSILQELFDYLFDIKQQFINKTKKQNKSLFFLEIHVFLSEKYVMR